MPGPRSSRADEEEPKPVVLIPWEEIMRTAPASLTDILAEKKAPVLQAMENIILAATAADEGVHQDAEEAIRSLPKEVRTQSLAQLLERGDPAFVTSLAGLCGTMQQTRQGIQQHPAPPPPAARAGKSTAAAAAAAAAATSKKPLAPPLTAAAPLPAEGAGGRGARQGSARGVKKEEEVEEEVKGVLGDAAEALARGGAAAAGGDGPRSKRTRGPLTGDSPWLSTRRNAPSAAATPVCEAPPPSAMGPGGTVVAAVDGPGARRSRRNAAPADA